MLKATLRTTVRSRLEANRQTLAEKSERIWHLLAEIAVFGFARKRDSLMCYADFQNEVCTTRYFARFLDTPDGSIILPFCKDDEIVPCRIRALDELEPGYNGILEPKTALQREPTRIVAPERIDVVIVPGLAFDVNGNRLGRGAGYYDRFLPKLPPMATVIGLAFECQVFESISTKPYDRPVDILVTEAIVRHFTANQVLRPDTSTQSSPQS